MMDRRGMQRDGSEAPAPSGPWDAPKRRNGRGAPDLDVLTGHLGYFMRRAQVAIFQDFIRTLGAIDVRPAQYSVLVVIGANPGLSQADVAQLLGIERARLVRLLDRLEKRGLTQRLASRVDRRSHSLKLTAAGRALLKRAKALAAAHEARLMEALGPARHRAIMDALRDFNIRTGRSGQPASALSTAAAILNRRRSWPLRPTSISPAARPLCRGNGSDIAHRSKKLAGLVLRRSIAFLRPKSSGTATSASVGATIGVVGSTSASTEARRASIARTGRGASAPCRCSRRQAMLRAPRSSRTRMNGSMASPRRVRPLAMDEERLGRREAALGVDLRHVVDQRDGSSLKRTPA